MSTKLYISGHRGLVGSALLRHFSRLQKYSIITRTHAELELMDSLAVRDFFQSERPDAVILAAAKVGGIHANATYPVDFLLNNLKIQNNVIENAYLAGVKKLVFLGSSCIYPKHAPQPMKEEHLLTSSLEPTNEPYALAKIAGLKLCQAYRRQYGVSFIAAMPTNLYGINDNFDLQNSHVLPAMIRKFHEAKERGDLNVVLWGSGSPRRELLHSDDLASACHLLLEQYNDESIINIGVGDDISIRDLANLVKEVVQYQGEIIWDTSKPDGTPRKLLDVSRIKNLGWAPTIALKEGIASTYDWYLKNKP